MVKDRGQRSHHRGSRRFGAAVPFTLLFLILAEVFPLVAASGSGFGFGPKVDVGAQFFDSRRSFSSSRRFAFGPNMFSQMVYSEV